MILVATASLDTVKHSLNITIIVMRAWRGFIRA